MKNNVLLALTVLVAMAVTISSLHAQSQIPRTISFQGVLTDASGVFLPDGLHSLRVTIYDNATAGTQLFQETQSVQVVRGVFNMEIGKSTPGGISTTLAFDRAYFLAIAVDGATTDLNPRTPLTAVPYSLNAIKADSSRAAFMADSAIGANHATVADTSDVLRGGAVTSINGQQGAITFVGAGGTNVARNGNQITIGSTSTGGIQEIINTDGSIGIVFATGPVVDVKLQVNSVRTDLIQDAAVTTAKIAPGAVTNDRIADNAVTSSKIADGTIITADVANNAIPAAKISTQGATAIGQALTYNGSLTPVWANPYPSGPAGGDLTGTYPNPQIAPGAVGTPEISNGAVTLPKINSTGALANQAIVFDGSNVVWSEPVADSLVLPYTHIQNSASTLFDLTNTGTGGAGRFAISNAASTTAPLAVATNGIGNGISVQLTNASNGGRGLDVLQAGVGPGVFATSAGGNALWGITSSISAAGVIGDNTFGEAVVGRNRGGNGVGAVVGRNDSSGYGVRGFNTKNGIGVLGQAGISGGTGTAGRFENVNAANTSEAVEVANNGIGSGISVQLTNASNGARGIDVTQAGVGPGVFATSAGGNALWGITSSISAAGVIGDNTFGEAVVGRNRGGNGVGAVVGRNDSSGYGVRGFNTKNGIGVLGQAGISGGTGNAGRFENVNAANTSEAVEVATNGIGSGISVQLTNASNGGRGIDVMQAGVGPGVFATSAGGNAVWGITSSISAAGVIGDNTFGEAVVGRNRGGNGVGAVVGRNDSSGYGVRGFNTKNGIGVLGQAGISGGTGVGGRFENVNAANTSDVLQVVTNSGGNAARFTGNVVVNGNLTVSGTVAKGGGTFRIDHPLDPENKYLYHSFVESPDMMNVHNGVITLDPNGEAWVVLPNWFQALNRDFRYQLTAVGAPGPNLHIASKVADNRFKIAGGQPGTEVSWQITGIRQDAWANQNRVVVEQDKPTEERGTLLVPIDTVGAPVVTQPGTPAMQALPSAAASGYKGETSAVAQPSAPVMRTLPSTAPSGDSVKTPAVAQPSAPVVRTLPSTAPSGDQQQKPLQNN